MSVIEKSKLDACLHGLDSCYVDMSKIGDLGMDQLEIPQKEFFDWCGEIGCCVRVWKYGACGANSRSD